MENQALHEVNAPTRRTESWETETFEAVRDRYLERRNASERRVSRLRLQSVLFGLLTVLVSSLSIQTFLTSRELRATNATNAQIADASAEFSRTRSALDSTLQELFTSNRDLLAAKVKAAQVEGEIAAAQAKAAELAGQLQDVKGNRGQLEGELNTVKRRLATLDERKRLAELSVDELQRSLASLGNQI